MPPPCASISAFIPENFSATAFFISPALSPIPLKKPPILSKNPLIPSTAPETTVLIPSHRPFQKLRNASLLFQRMTKAATRAVIAMITMVMGLAAIRAKSPLMAVFTVCTALTIFGASFITAPTPVAILPTAIKTGPMAAATAARVRTIFCVAGSMSMMAFITLMTFSIRLWKAGATASPMVTVRTSKVDFNCSIVPPVPDMRASAMLSAEPVTSSRALRRPLTSSGEDWISVSHLDIWFFPKMFAAASSFSWSVRPENAEFRFEITVGISFNVPLSLKIA